MLPFLFLGCRAAGLFPLSQQSEQLLLQLGGLVAALRDGQVVQPQQVLPGGQSSVSTAGQTGRAETAVCCRLLYLVCVGRKHFESIMTPLKLTSQVLLLPK